MRISGVLLLAAALVGCGVPERPILAGSQSPPSAHDFSRRFLAERLQVVSSPELHASAQAKVLKILEFLASEFGPPPTDIFKFTIRFQDGFTGHLKITEFEDGSRLLVVDPIYLRDDQEHVLVHELFHLTYQSAAMMRAYNNHVLESWATYAQYRYLYKGNDNRQIAQTLRRDFSIGPREASDAALGADIPGGLSGAALQKRYAAGSLALFDASPYDNFVAYRGMIQKAGRRTILEKFTD